MNKRDRERLRLAMAHALLNASRPLALADSPLLQEAAVASIAREHYSGAVIAEELALGDLVREAGKQVVLRLGQDPRLTRERAVLETVLAGGSVRSAAQALEISREHLSNTAWKTVTAWVLDAFEDICTNARRGNAPVTTSRLISLQ
jgi:hypothetical protein